MSPTLTDLPQEVAAILEHRAAESPERVFYLMSDVTETFGSCNEKANRFAHGLSRLGVGQRDMVALMMPNIPEHLTTRFAVNKLGAIEVSINATFRGPGLVHMLNLCEAETLVVDDSYLDQVIARLRPHASEPDVDFRIRAVDSEEVNAFALPGGQMVVMGGLLEAAEGPEEVAGVLAHEMAHVTERHGLKGAAHGAGRWLALSLLIGDDSAWVALAGQAADVASGSAYSREQEAAADAEGARLMAAAGLDPTALARFFERLKQEPGSELTGMASWISSHPEHDERIAHVRELAATLPTAPHRPLNVDWAAVRAAAAQ